MNIKLNEVFNIAPEVKEVEFTEKPMVEIVKQVECLDKIDSALPHVEGMVDDAEMDELAKTALDGYTALFELGMNVDPKQAGEIFSVAGNLLGHSITARQNKILKKLKMVELQIKKHRIDTAKELAKKSLGDDEQVITGTATVIDRNSLIAQLSAKKSV